MRLYGGRTYIVESYVFELDFRGTLPLDLAPAEAFTRNATLDTLVRSWQRDISIRALNRSGWRRPGTFYVRVGTENSFGSGLPQGHSPL